KEENRRPINDLKHKALMTGLKGIASVMPDVERPNSGNYESKHFMPGNDVFLTEPAAGAKWKLGYADASLLPDDIGFGEYYLGGYLAFPPNRVEDALDDQMVRCFCLDDGSGRGTSVFAVIDCVGISNRDIREIRRLLEGFCAENNIITVNVAATHSHSCIDTQGLWGPIPKALKYNPFYALLGRREGFVSGRNDKFMGNLHRKSADAIKRAFADMKEGRLYASVVDATSFVRDKRKPDVMVTDLASLRFVPDDGSRPTRAVFLPAHPVCFGQYNKTVSGDFPYYCCKEIEANGENGLFFNGPEAAIAANRGPNIPEGLDFPHDIIAYGAAIAQHSIKAEFKEIEPMLNVRCKELLMSVDNPLFYALSKLHVTYNDTVKDGKKMEDIRFVSETGYVEMGKSLKFMFIPGEMMPEVFLGGAFGAEDSYTGKSWDYKPIKDMVDGYLVGIGLCNDAVGYIVPSNDYGSYFEGSHYEEAVSTGTRCAADIVDGFEDLVEECKTLKN
ncbi:MAG: hypothetical protein FWF08_01435, partial [Oscillospiraceae bacterium]|nr:hypothetical protein [Oscillospiraceae bacterium]